jgi:HEPN domain-containing protein
MTRKFKTIPVNKDDSRKYLIKALEYMEEANRSHSERKFSSSGLLAIHAAISAADSILGFAVGYRSGSPDHGDAVELVRQQLRCFEDSSKQANRLSRIIGKKNLVEYESRSLTEKEAYYLVEQAERFLDWVRNIVVFNPDPG